MIYKTKDIEKIFTDKVNKFVSKGYIYNCGTMSGTQGEIAKVDLISPDRKQIVRIFMDEEYDKDYNDVLSITTKLYVPKNEYINVNSLGHNHVLWIEHGTEYDKQIFYSIDRLRTQSTFTDKETLEEIKKIRNTRYDSRSFNFNRYGIRKRFDAKYNKIVLSWLKRQPKCKSMKLSDIDYVEKHIDNDRVHYNVWAKGKIHYFKIK